MKKLIENLSIYFKEHYNTTIYPNQTVDSCEAFYNLCMKENPQKILEIGTNFGASTFSFIKYLIDKNIPLCNLTTIDLFHEHWKEKTPIIQKDLLKDYNINLAQILTITKDFNLINPSDLLDNNYKTLIFYDMHDHTGPWSLKLLNEWYPYIKKGIIIIHDISKIHPTYSYSGDKPETRSRAVYEKTGQHYAGFLECERIINWANQNNIELYNISGGIFFKKE